MPQHVSWLRCMMLSHSVSEHSPSRVTLFISLSHPAGTWRLTARAQWQPAPNAIHTFCTCMWSAASHSFTFLELNQCQNVGSSQMDWMCRWAKNWSSSYLRPFCKCFLGLELLSLLHEYLCVCSGSHELCLHLSFASVYQKPVALHTWI